MGNNAIINIILESLNGYYPNRLPFIKYEYEKGDMIWLYFMECLIYIIINKAKWLFNHIKVVQILKLSILKPILYHIIIIDYNQDIKDPH